MRISDGKTSLDIEEIETLLFRSKNSLLSIDFTINDPTYGHNILFSLNDERISHGELEDLAEDHHKQYLDQVRHLALHGGLLDGAITNLDGLVDVAIVDPQNRQVFMYNGSRWINSLYSHSWLTDLDADSHPHYLTVDRHEDVDIHNFYDPEHDTGNLPHDSIKNLTDVEIDLIRNGQFLQWQSGRVVPADVTQGDVSHTHDDFLKRDGTNRPSADINFNGKKIANLGAPVSDGDAATKGYVDKRTWKDPVIDIVSALPNISSNGDRYAISNLCSDELMRGMVLEKISGEWVIDGQEAGIAVYSLADKRPYYWNLTDWVGFGSGSGSGASAFVDLDDVDSSNPRTGQIYVIDANGNLVNKTVEEVIGLALTAPVQLNPNTNHVLFSNGQGGTFTNGIKTNEYGHFDLNQNRIKNAVIDCGAYYG